MKCPKCFTENPEEHSFCFKCGSSLKDESKVNNNQSLPYENIRKYMTDNHNRMLLGIIIIAVIALIALIPKDNVSTNTNANKEKEITGLIQQAEALYRNGDYDKAKEVYKNIVTKFPNTNEAAKANEILANYDAVVKQKMEEKQIALQKKQAEDEAKKKAYEESIKPPLALVEAKVQLNVISNPEARVIVKNTSNKIVDAYTVGIYCYDRYDNPVKQYGSGSNRYGGISQKTINPGETEGYNSYWTLYGHENTAKVEVVLEKAHCTDGTVWTPQGSQRVSTKGVLDR